MPNNKMLVLARESRGLTQQQLVEKIPNLTQGNYSKMEKGMIAVPDETLQNIANALDYPVVFFNKNGVHTGIASFYYRKRATLPKKQLSELEAKMDIIRIAVDELLDSVDIPAFSLPSFEINKQCSMEDAARKLREHLQLPRGPISNLVNILETAGVIVYFLKTDAEKFDGITLRTDKGQPIIFVNEAMPNDRKRFTIAHELMHLVCHIPYSPLEAGRDEEYEANNGAAEFLMPYLDCRAELQNLRMADLHVLKNHWGLSKAMILFRAKEIKAITPQRCTNLYIELARNGERKQETGYVSIDQPTLLKLMVNTFENSLGYTLEEILNMLGLKERDYFAYFSDSKYNTIVRPKIIQFTTRRSAS